MILALGERRQVWTLQVSQVPKALKIQALERVRTILSCLAGFGEKITAYAFDKSLAIF